MASPTETAITQAGIDLVEWMSAYDHGAPADQKVTEARKALVDAVNAHAGENDGKLPVSDPDDAKLPWINSLLFNALSDLVGGEDDMLKWASKCRAARKALARAKEIS